jgi:hypothetical protein
MYWLISSLLLALVQSKTVNEAVAPRPVPDILIKAHEFIRRVQEPENCTNLEFAVADMGISGGFAAQFQLAAAEWMRTFAGAQFKLPVLLMGRLHGYSDGPQCSNVKHDWTCYFHPVSSCQAELLATGKRVSIKHWPSDEACVPPAFAAQGKYSYVMLCVSSVFFVVWKDSELE